MKIDGYKDKSIIIQCNQRELKLILDAMSLGLLLFSQELWRIVKDEPEEFDYSRRKFDRIDKLHHKMIDQCPFKYKNHTKGFWVPATKKGDGERT